MARLCFSELYSLKDTEPATSRRRTEFKPLPEIGGLNRALRQLVETLSRSLKWTGSQATGRYSILHSGKRPGR